MSRPVSVQVPASTSNLGAGFDCVGVALSLWLRVEVTLLEAGDAGAALVAALSTDGRKAGGLELRRSGTLASLDVAPAEDRIVVGFQEACAAAGKGRASVVIDAHSDIPIGRGLGSSAAATVAGALAARSVLHLDLDDQALLALCARIEGHPDNVAPILSGGATLVTRADDRLIVTPLDVDPGLAFVLAVPPFAVQTDAARSILPADVSHRTAATAASHAAALIHGLAHGDGALLGVALDDVLHVPFRRRLIPGYERVTAAARAAGAFGATLSGSGSSILAITAATDAVPVGEAMARAWLADGIVADILHPSIVTELACL